MAEKDRGRGNVWPRAFGCIPARFRRAPGWASRNWLHTPAQSGGVAVDMHVHDVDFVRYLLGEPDRIQAGVYRDSDGLIEQIFAIYNYGRDVAVSVEAAWDYPASFPFSATFRVKLEKATITNDANGLTVYPNDGDAFHPGACRAIYRRQPHRRQYFVARRVL